jgi:hypothetical protein
MSCYDKIAKSQAIEEYIIFARTFHGSYSFELIFSASVELNDLFNIASGNFIASNAPSSAVKKNPPPGAAVIVCVPPGGKVTYDYKKMLVNGIVVD